MGQFSYVWPDVATFVLLPMALPSGRILGAWRWVAGVVAASGGNHGAAVAYAAMRLGVPATIFTPSITAAAMNATW